MLGKDYQTALKEESNAEMLARLFLLRFLDCFAHEFGLLGLRKGAV